ncbi:citramalate synthase, partial [Burkholderia pseudomallei]
MRLAARRHPCNGRRKRRASAPPRAPSRRPV